MAASLVKDLDTRPGTRSSEPGRFKAIAGRVYFAATAPRTGSEVYSTDADGNLRLLGDIAPGPASSSPEPVAGAGNRLVVSADDGVTGRQLWSLPFEGGTPARLTSLSGFAFSGGALDRLNLAIGGRVLLTPRQDEQLISTDGTPQGTFERTPQTGFPLRTVSRGCALNGMAVVDGYDDDGHHYLVRTNGLPGGDSVVATLPQDSTTVGAVALSGQCHFLLSTGVFALQHWSLWRSDGTAAGSAQVTSVQADARGMAALGNDLYVLEHVAEMRLRLRRLAGGNAPAETVVELDAQLTYNVTLSTHEGYLLFDAYSVGANGWEKALYVSDGTAAGTRRLHPSVGESAEAAQWYPVAGAVVRESAMGPDLRIELASGQVTPLDSEPFDYENSVALDGIRIGAGARLIDREVWITAGRAGTTRLLHDIWADTQHGVAPPWNINTAAAVDDKLFFTDGYDPAASGALGALWRTDGSESGTVMLPPVFHGENSPRQVQRYGEGVLFTTAFNGLYHADAILNSAVAVAGSNGGFLQPVRGGAAAIFVCGASADLCGMRPGDAGSWLANGEFWAVIEVGDIGGVAVFGRSGRNELWRSDGTAPGTYRLLSNLRVNAAPDRTQDAVLRGKLYFIGCIDTDVCDLMATDGTVAGTGIVRPMPARGLHQAARAGDRLVLGVGSGGAEQLWATDGSAAGTVLLYNRTVRQFASTGTYVHMHAYCASCKSQYLVTDGTPTGTRTVELPAALRHSGTFAAALGDNAVVFSCDNQRRGTELCVADAAADTVVPLPEIFPGAESSQPRPLGRTMSAVYFSADDGLHGREPWQLRRLPDGVFADGFD